MFGQKNRDGISARPCRSHNRGWDAVRPVGQKNTIDCSEEKRLERDMLGEGSKLKYYRGMRLLKFTSFPGYYMVSVNFFQLHHQSGIILSIFDECRGSRVLFHHLQLDIFLIYLLLLMSLNYIFFTM